MVSYTIILVYHYCTLLSRPRILPDVLSPHRRSRSSLFSLVLFPAWRLPQKPTKINENWKSFGNVQKMQKGTFFEKKKQNGDVSATLWIFHQNVMNSRGPPIFKCLWLERLRQLVQAWNRCTEALKTDENHGISWKIMENHLPSGNLT